MVKIVHCHSVQFPFFSCRFNSLLSLAGFHLYVTSKWKEKQKQLTILKYSHYTRHVITTVNVCQWNVMTSLPPILEASVVYVSQTDRLITAAPLQMSSCSTWKHHLVQPNSCCSESTCKLCEGHKQGHSHTQTNITHTLIVRLKIEKKNLL